MRRTSLAEMPCPIARSLDLLGEWWTLLIVRDALLGARRFEDFKASGIADNILSARLRRLVEAEVLERRPYQLHPERFEYLLTDKGRALTPVLVSLWSWGQTWTSGRTRVQIKHAACGHEVGIQAHCEHCGRALTPQEISVARP